MKMSGFVTVAGQTFTATQLNAGELLRLALLLRQLYQKQQGHAYRRVKDMIAEMPKEQQGYGVAECVRIEAQGELPGQSAEHLARTTPEGVALELWMCIRKNHPEVTLDALKAIITDVNCLDVYSDLQDVVTPPGESDDTKR